MRVPAAARARVALLRPCTAVALFCAIALLTLWMCAVATTFLVVNPLCRALVLTYTEYSPITSSRETERQVDRSSVRRPETELMQSFLRSTDTLLHVGGDNNNTLGTLSHLVKNFTKWDGQQQPGRQFDRVVIMPHGVQWNSSIMDIANVLPHVVHEHSILLFMHFFTHEALHTSLMLPYFEEIASVPGLAIFRPRLEHEKGARKVKQKLSLGSAVENGFAYYEMKQRLSRKTSCVRLLIDAVTKPFVIGAVLLVQAMWYAVFDDVVFKKRIRSSVGLLPVTKKQRHSGKSGDRNKDAGSTGDCDKGRGDRDEGSTNTDAVARRASETKRE